MANTIANELSKVDPDNAQYYQQNLQQFSQRLKTLSQKIKADLKPLKDKPYVVFHNNWQYFAYYFGLHEPSVVSMQESITPGIKSILKMRQHIEEKNIHCIFSDPQTTRQRIKTLTENIKIKNVEIDVLGRGLLLNKDSYASWLEDMSTQIKACLEED